METLASFEARPAPGPLALLREQVEYELRAPAGLGRELANTLARPARLTQKIPTRVRAVAGLLRCGLGPVWH